MGVPARIFLRNHEIFIELPLTSPTGKIRVKRRDKNSNYGSPVATKQNPFTQADYLEWQISYATENPPSESRVNEIAIDENHIGFELTKLLYEGAKIGIFTKTDFIEMENFANTVQLTETLEENERIFREDLSQEIKGGFKKFKEKVPLFIKEDKPLGYFVEIIIQHKGKAVGLQAMIYLCIYIDRFTDIDNRTLIGRMAKVKEFCKIKLTTINKNMFIDVVKAFAIASQKHKRDITEILRQIKRQCTP